LQAARRSELDAQRVPGGFIPASALLFHFSVVIGTPTSPIGFAPQISLLAIVLSDRRYRCKSRGKPRDLHRSDAISS
jgi:hypothetical protein